jgi:transcriptional regulator with XRE-family HTH domain
MSTETQYKSEIALFCEHIKSLRKARDLTQNQLKVFSGITQSQISLLEKPGSNPNPEFDTLVKLSTGLKSELKFLFSYKSKSLIPVLKRKFKTVESRAIFEKTKFGSRIESLCDHRGLLQEELAILSKIDAADLSRYINGEGNIEFFSILKIAIALEVKLFTLFDYDGPLPDNKSFKGKIQN